MDPYAFIHFEGQPVLEKENSEFKLVLFVSWV